MTKIKALFLAANPNGTTKLALDEEIREITQKIRLAENRDLLDVISVWAVRPDDLLQYLNQHKPQIVHFSGHGRYSEAEPLCFEALELRKELFGENHPDVALSLNNLAKLYFSQGRYSEAEPLYFEALELAQEVLGEQHSLVATIKDNLAKLYLKEGRYSEAEALCFEALELRKELFGENHPDVALSLDHLGLLYFSQGRYSEAEPLYIEALEIAEQTLGVNHPKTVTIRENLQDLRDKR